MASRAVWRTAPGDPRSGLGWLLRDGRRWARLLLKKALLGVFVLGAYALFVGATLAFLALVAAFAALAAVVPDRHKAPSRDDPPFEPSFAGPVEVRRAGVHLGDDQVVVTLIDGWLHVEGARLAFDLRSDDVAAIAPKAGSHLLLKDGSELRFSLASGRPSTSSAEFARRSTFADALRRWTSTDPPPGESVLPPDRPHPLARIRAGTDLVVATVGTFVGFTVVIALGFWWGFFALMLVPGPSLTEAIVGLVRLRRLERTG